MGVFSPGRRHRVGDDDHRTAWVRVTRSCQQACVFCNDVDHLDGTQRPLEEVCAELDDASRQGKERAILSGGEPTDSPHLLKILRHGSSLGLTLAMTSHGRRLARKGASEALLRAGLQEVRISLHSGSRTSHDLLVGSHGAWVQALAGMRQAAAAGLVVTLHMVLCRDNVRELGHLVRLAAMAGVTRARLIRMASEGRGAAVEHGQRLPLDEELEVLDRLWRDCVAQGVYLDAVGWDGTSGVHVAVDPPDEPPSLDAAALAMVRRKVELASIRLGVRASDPEGRLGAFLELASEEGGVRALAWELAEAGFRWLDLPPCLGGTRTGAEGANDYGPACDACPQRATCPGAPVRLVRDHPEALGWPPGSRLSADRQRGPA